MASASANSDFVEALGVGAGGGIAVVDAVDVLDEAAARAELLGEEERREIGAAASEQRDTAAAIAGDEAGNDGDAALIEHVHRWQTVRR